MCLSTRNDDFVSLLFDASILDHFDVSPSFAVNPLFVAV